MQDYLDGKKMDDPSLEGLYNRPDYISPLDDLAFDMYQDPEIAQIIRRLEKKKQEAVLRKTPLWFFVNKSLLKVSNSQYRFHCVHRVCVKCKVLWFSSEA